MKTMTPSELRRNRLIALPIAIAAIMFAAFCMLISPARATAAPEASAKPISFEVPWWTVTPCATDEPGGRVVNCAWDAQRQGNGRGHSHIVRQVPGSAGMVCVFYVERGYARSHDYCTATRA